MRERVEANKQFREAFDARRYSDALPLAERVVTLTEEQYGQGLPRTRQSAHQPRHGSLPAEGLSRGGEGIPAQRRDPRRHRRRDGSAAAAPLHGLGAAHFAESEYVDASVALKRAIDLSRNVDGLFNIQQLQILEPLIASYVALDLDGRSRERAAVRPACCRRRPMAAWTRACSSPLEQYGRWLESWADTPARVCSMPARSRSRNRPAGAARRSRSIPLLGIARSYRLEFVNGTEEAVPAQDNFGNVSDLVARAARRPAPECRWRARPASGAAGARRQKPVDHAQAR